MDLMDMLVLLGFLGFLRRDTEVHYPRGLTSARQPPLQRRSKGVEQWRAWRAGRTGGRSPLSDPVRRDEELHLPKRGDAHHDNNDFNFHF